MKYFFSFCCLFLLATAQCVAQQTHFIFLQTDNHQPFYVMMKNKNYSSSSIGYIILPKLENGDYRIKVGFAKSETPEQDYILQVKDNDQGFLIKDFGDKGGGIFNLQTFAIQYNGEEGHKLDAVANAKRDAENQKLIAQQQKDSTEKAEALLAEQKKAENEARIANEAQQKEQAAALAKQQTENNVKAENEARIALEAKQKKDAAILAKQQAADSIKAVKTAKVTIKPQPKTSSAALTKQQAAAKAKEYKEYWAAQREKEKSTADSLAKTRSADNARAENEAKMAEAAAQKRAEDALAQKQAEEKTKADEQKRLDILAAQKATADALQKQKDSLAMDEKNKAQAVVAAAQSDTNKTIAPPQVSTDKSVNATIVYQPVLVAKNNSDSGTNIIYKIPSNKGWDTVVAYIEAPVTEKKNVDTTPVATDKSGDVKFLDMHFKQDSADKAKEMITPVFNAPKPKQTEIVMDTVVTKSDKVPQTSEATTTKTETKETISTTPTTNSNCRAVADDKDFFALRKKMVAKDDVDEMILLAKKSMKEKCYSTFQIRNLSALMITDAERYQFLEMAYPFVSDANNYASLTDLLKDNYYGDRFRAMLRK